MLKIPVFKKIVMLVLYVGIITLYMGTIEIFLLRSSSHAATPEEQYYAAINYSKSLKKSPERQKYRHNWLNGIKKFQAIYSETPNNSLASSAMYHEAELYINLYRISAIQKDKSEAVDLLNRIIKRYPSTTDREMAEKLLSSLQIEKSDLQKEAPEKSSQKKVTSNSAPSESTKEPPTKEKANKRDAISYPIDNESESSSAPLNGNESPSGTTSPNGNAYITDLRYWTTPDYTRIVINISDERRYVYKFLDENPSMKKPQRLYLDIKKASVGKNLPSHTRINDDLLIQARAGQYTDEIVRVVVDIKSFDNYKVFSLKDPFRVIFDVWGDKSDKHADSASRSKPTATFDSLSRVAESKSSQATADSKQTIDPASSDVPLSEISSEKTSNASTKKSTKRSTRRSELTVSEEPSKVEADSSTLISETASSDKVQPETSSGIYSKTSTKTATRASSVDSPSKSGTPSRSAPEIASETDSKEASSLPVKRSLKAATIVISDSTRKLLRRALEKDSNELAISDSKESSEERPKEFSDKSTKELSRADIEQSPRHPSGKATKGTTRVVEIAPGSNVDRIKASSIAKQLALGVRTIVIDPGHGGKDPGASGSKNGVYEKHLVLDLSKKLAGKIRNRLNCNVIMTRSSDTFLTLEERTAIANTKSADLFISLHCNASNDKKLVGIETYYLNLATDERAINVAARENATSRKNISDLESILNDLMKNAKINESSRLAAVVQKNLYNGMAKQYSRIKNLGVKQAPFYVLLGASMPSILIETSFISNPEEGRRLADSAYQNALCDAITDGIAKYIRETNP